MGYRFVSDAQEIMRTNVSTFEVVPLDTNGILNGSNNQNGFINGHFYYRHAYNFTWKFWSGIAVSNHTDTINGTFTNEYSNIVGGGINGSKNFGVCYEKGTIIVDTQQILTGFYVTNTTYTYKTIKNGSAFSKKFGGVTGNDPDWFRLKVMNFSKGKRSDSLWFYLADYRNSDNTKDYIINSWEWIDLKGFKASDSLELTFESSDTGQFGMNTPAYVALDDFNAADPNSFNIKNGGVYFGNPGFFKNNKFWNGSLDTSGGFYIDQLYFENRYNTAWDSWSGWAISKDFDTTKSGYGAQYSVACGHDTKSRWTSDSGFAVSYGRSIIRLPYKKGGWPVTNFRMSITNNTYAYKSMKFGDAFSKKFGGLTGNDPDFLRLYVIGYDDKNIAVDTLNNMFVNDELYLADFRNGSKYLSQSWQNIISGGFKKNIVRIEFQLESTDNGSFGMNTPEYFCLDGLFELPIESVSKISSKQIMVYPNPANDFIYCDVQNVQSFEIVNSNGQIVLNSQNPETNQIDVSGLISGVYIIRVNSNSLIKYGRFIKL